jgi:hypothetical protein
MEGGGNLWTRLGGGNGCLSHNAIVSICMGTFNVLERLVKEIIPTPKKCMEMRMKRPWILFYYRDHSVSCAALPGNCRCGGEVEPHSSLNEIAKCSILGYVQRKRIIHNATQKLISTKRTVYASWLTRS